MNGTYLINNAAKFTYHSYDVHVYSYATTAFFSSLLILQFYKLLSLALFSRYVFLPYKAYIYYNDTEYHQELLCLEAPSCIMARSVPDLAFATSYSLLVVFYAQLAGTASAGGPKGLSLLLSQRGLFGIANAVIYTF